MEQLTEALSGGQVRSRGRHIGLASTRSVNMLEKLEVDALNWMYSIFTVSRQLASWCRSDLCDSRTEGVGGQADPFAHRLDASTA